MSQANSAGDPRARLRDVSEALVHAYRALCHHSPDEGAAACSRCPSCDHIAEVRDMIRCAADTIFEASALCAHFQRELRTVLGNSRAEAGDARGVAAVAVAHSRSR